ncbi:uncharacterized protein LOC129572177 [Sitodiplosis mosellana]|uniref:uncharacterized protein LOC129572177 n=1 Tax=Sitodiplosis mosellana TaxID=263140 RepID=UPI00244533D9|nr:uncharacterized protein LOC129572177 [Sitodiplosis mosellana]
MFKLRNSSRKSSSSESPNSPETLGSKNINDSVAKTVQTTSVSDVATMNVDGVQKSSELDNSSKSISDTVIETVSSTVHISNTNDELPVSNTDLSIIGAASTEQHTTDEISKSQSLTEVKSRPLERTGKNCNEGYFIDDRSEININFQKYRMVFVVNKDAVFYKKSAIRQARQTHPKVTKARAHKFHKFVQKWCEENVNEEQRKQCADWFMGKQADQIPNIITIKVQENDLTKTPYALYNRYKVQHLNN